MPINLKISKRFYYNVSMYVWLIFVVNGNKAKCSNYNGTNGKRWH